MDRVMSALVEMMDGEEMNLEKVRELLLALYQGAHGEGMMMGILHGEEIMARLEAAGAAEARGEFWED